MTARALAIDRQRKGRTSREQLYAHAVAAAAARRLRVPAQQGVAKRGLSRTSKSCCAWWKRCEFASSALDGMQPTFRQVPPRVPRISTHATCGDDSGAAALSSGSAYCTGEVLRRARIGEDGPPLQPQLRSLDRGDVACEGPQAQKAVSGRRGHPCTWPAQPHSFQGAHRPGRLQ